MNSATAFFRDGRAFPTERQLDEAADSFAELLAQGRELNEASLAMGVSAGTGCVLFRRICEGLGVERCR